MCMCVCFCCLAGYYCATDHFKRWLLAITCSTMGSEFLGCVSGVASLRPTVTTRFANAQKSLQHRVFCSGRRSHTGNNSRSGSSARKAFSSESLPQPQQQYWVQNTNSVSRERNKTHASLALLCKRNTMRQGQRQLPSQARALCSKNHPHALTWFCCISLATKSSRHLVCFLCESCTLCRSASRVAALARLIALSISFRSWASCCFNCSTSRMPSSNWDLFVAVADSTRVCCCVATTISPT